MTPDMIRLAGLMDLAGWGWLGGLAALMLLLGCLGHTAPPMREHNSEIKMPKRVK